MTRVAPASDAGVQVETIDQRPELDLSSVPARSLSSALLRKVTRRLLGRVASRRRSSDGRYVWNVGAVSNSLSPEADFRNYFEHRNIREIIGAHVGRIGSACELGCGYGRVLPVLTEIAGRVVGLERERHLLDIARRQLPDVELVNVQSLDEVDRHGPFDLIMTCTVLQHLPDAAARRVLESVKRAAPRGWVLLVEKSGGPVADEGDVSSDRDFLSRSRDVSVFEEWMRPFVLVAVADRRLEATYPAIDGKLMLFGQRQRPQ